MNLLCKKSVSIGILLSLILSTSLSSLSFAMLSASPPPARTARVHRPLATDRTAEEGAAITAASHRPTSYAVQTPEKSRAAANVVQSTPQTPGLQNAVYLFHPLPPAAITTYKVNLRNEILTPARLIEVFRPIARLVESLKTKSMRVESSDLSHRIAEVTSLALQKAQCNAPIDPLELMAKLQPLLTLQKAIDAEAPALHFARYIGQVGATESNPRRSVQHRFDEHMASANDKDKLSCNRFYAYLREIAREKLKYSEEELQQRIQQTNSEAFMTVQALAYNIAPTQLDLVEGYFIDLFNSAEGDNGLNSKKDGVSKYKEFLANGGSSASPFSHAGASSAAGGSAAGGSAAGGSAAGGSAAGGSAAGGSSAGGSSAGGSSAGGSSAAAAHSGPSSVYSDPSTRTLQINSLVQTLREQAAAFTSPQLMLSPSAAMSPSAFTLPQLMPSPFAAMGSASFTLPQQPMPLPFAAAPPSSTDVDAEMEDGSQRALNFDEE